MSTGVRFLHRKSFGIRLPEEDGLVIRRYLGTPELEALDPFLLLDWVETTGAPAEEAGFRPHPHRGLETATLVFAGRMRHRDNRGGAGEIGPGGIQWMRAGQGLIHEERPLPEAGRFFGLQFWLNLPRAEKGAEPYYVNGIAESVPEEVRDEGAVRLRVLAGASSLGTRGPVLGGATEPRLLEARLAPGALLREPVPETHEALVLVLAGTVTLTDIAGRPAHAAAGTLVELADGDLCEVASAAGAHVILAAARPIGEPTVRGGPFVMNSRAEVLQAYRDYQEGRFGAGISTSGAAS